MQISIELQYLHASIQISFASSEYDSSEFSVGTSPANNQIHAIYFLSSYFWYFVFVRCSAGALQCLQIFYDVVQCANRILAVRCGRSAVKVCLRHLFDEGFRVPLEHLHQHCHERDAFCLKYWTLFLWDAVCLKYCFHFIRTKFATI